MPRICFVNKMDRVGADFARTIEHIRTKLGANPVAVQIPIGTEDRFAGVVDLVRMKAIRHADETLGAAPVVEEIPDALREEAMAYRELLVEKVSEVDDELLSRYLHGDPLPEDRIRATLRRRTIESLRGEDAPFVPVLCGSAFRNKGVQPLLDGIVDYLPSPEDVPPISGVNPVRPEGAAGRVVERPADDSAPFSALAFKVMTDPYVGRLTFVRVYSGVMKTGATVSNTVRGHRERIGRLLKMHANKREEINHVSAGDIAAAVGLKNVGTGDTICDPHHPVVLESMEFPSPVISLAIEPMTKADQEKLAQGLAKLTAEDPTFQVQTDEEVGQVVISGMGELHLEILVDRLQREFGVEARVGRPQVAYKETLTRPSEGEGRYVKQTGGRGQYGHVKIRVAPAPPGNGFEFGQRHRRRRRAARVHPVGRGRDPRRDDHRRARRLSHRGRRRVAVRRLVPCRRLVRGRLPDCRRHGLPRRRAQGRCGAARARHAHRGGRSRGVHGGRDQRSERPARQGPLDGGAGRYPDHQRARPAGGDVRLRHGASLADAGPRDVPRCTSIGTSRCPRTSASRS